MSDEDHTKIPVGDHVVGIIGLKAAMAELAADGTQRSTDEIASALLAELRKKNYIPASALATYGNALVREFRKFVGLPHEEPERRTVQVVLVGPGCYQCDALERAIIHVLDGMRIPAAFEHVTDLHEIARYGFMRLPALIVNGIVVSQGSVPDEKKIREMLQNAGQQLPDR